MTEPLSQPSSRKPAGFSLLEVLVACGILVIALSSIAALLPAAGSRLADATAQDRAAATAAAAMAEIQARGLVSRGLIPTGSVGGSAFLPSAVAFGETLSLAVTSSATAAGYVTTSGPLAVTSTSSNVTLPNGGTVSINALRSGMIPVLSEPVPTFIGVLMNYDTLSTDRRGFFIEDEVQYGLSATGDQPSNAFVNGVRQFNRGVCWGATIAPFPDGTAASAMTAARVSVAVFRKSGGATAITLTASNGVFQTSGVNTPSSLQRTILKPCSSVLAIPAATITVPPRWLTIRSSWLSGTTPLANLTSATTCVVFGNDDITNDPNFRSGSQLNVLGFDGLILVKERIVTVR